MNWQKLKKNKCPNCRAQSDLTQALFSGRMECSNCNFSVSKERYMKVVNAFNRPARRATSDEQLKDRFINL